MEVLPSEHLAHLPEGTFNLQIQALEVTQGVSGEIPTRMAPQGDFNLTPVGTVHVANRWTVVRAYPWISQGTGVKVPPFTALLWGYCDGEMLPGSPLLPKNIFLEGISPDWNLETMRADVEKSLNFILPAEWTKLNKGEKPISLTLVVEVNPAGHRQAAECQDCYFDNQVVLRKQTFVFVPSIKIKPYLVTHNFEDNEGRRLNFLPPTLEEVQFALETVRKFFPIGNGANGIEILIPEQIVWDGPVYKNGEPLFLNSMKQYVIQHATSEELFHVFLFSPSFQHRNQVEKVFDGSKTGLAWIGKPYLQAGARGQELVHELTHALGLDHSGNLHGETSFNPDYPDDCGRVEQNAFGFDIVSMQVIPPDSVYGRTHDFMSYERSKPIWISSYTWEQILERLLRIN